MKKSRNLGNNTLFLIILFGMMVLAEITIRYKEIPNYILPSPSNIFKAIISQRHLLIEHSLVTIFESVLGFILSIIIAIVLGGIIYPFKRVKEVLYPFLLISQTIPLIAVAPMILLWLGFGMMPKVVIVILISTFPILVSFLEGLDQVDKDLINLMKVMKADKRTIFRKVVLPGSMPNLFAGLKIAATYAIMGAVIGEWLGAEKGLGIYMTRSITSFKTENLFAAIITVVALSIILFKGVEKMEEIIMPWKK